MSQVQPTNRCRPLALVRRESFETAALADMGFELAVFSTIAVAGTGRTARGSTTRGPENRNISNFWRQTPRRLDMVKTVEIERFFPTLEALAAAGGVSVLLVLAALRNPAIWEVIGGGIGGGIDPRTLSTEARSELHSALSEILAGV